MGAKKLNLEVVVLGLSIFAFLLFLATAFNSFYWMDDFWKRYEVLHQGFFSFQKEIYLNWDGRAISPIYSFRNLLLYLFDYPQAWAVTLIGMTFLTGTGYVGARLISGDSWETCSRIQKVTMVILFTLVLVMVFRPHLSRSLYWGTGTFYMIANFFTLLTVYALVKNPNSWWNILLVWIVCTSGPNNGLMLIGFLFFGYFFKVINIQKKNFIALLIFSLLCLSLVILTPGNLNRGGGQFNWQLISLIHGFFFVLKEYSGMSLWAVLGGFFIGLSYDIFLSKNAVRLFFLLILCGLISILPFLPFPNAASKHTAIFFQTFALLSLIFISASMKNLLNINLPKQIGFFLIMFFQLYFIFQVRIQLITGNSIKTEMDKRFQTLEENRGKRTLIVFDRIELPSSNWVSRFRDISVNPDDSNNKNYQIYFDTGKIVLSPI